MDKETQTTVSSVDPVVENSQLLRKLIRQLKFLNFMIVSFGIVSIIGAIVFGILAWKGVEMIANSKDQITSLINPTSGTSSEDLQKQLCSGTGTVSSYIKSNTDVCK